MKRAENCLRALHGLDGDEADEARAEAMALLEEQPDAVHARRRLVHLENWIHSNVLSEGA